MLMGCKEFLPDNRRLVVSVSSPSMVCGAAWEALRDGKRRTRCLTRKITYSVLQHDLMALYDTRKRRSAEKI